MGPDIYSSSLPEPWHQLHSQMNEEIPRALSIAKSARFPLGILACLFCSPGRSVNWLVLPNRPCTSSDWCVSVQTLPWTRSQMAHIPSLAARQNKGRFRTLLRELHFFGDCFPHLCTYACLVLWSWLYSMLTHISVPHSKKIGLFFFSIIFSMKQRSLLST